MPLRLTPTPRAWFNCDSTDACCRPLRSGASPPCLPGMTHRLEQSPSGSGKFAAAPAARASRSSNGCQIRPQAIIGRPSPIRKPCCFTASRRPGKLEVVATKPMATQRDLSLAYSPGVAVPVLAIAEDEALAFDYTTKGNFVAVITNGTAILGLGNLGALAAKPVMEGKAVLFKRFADIDSIDLEVSSEDPDEIINCVKLLGKSWGGINLEDIKAPECFIIEQRLRELLDIPVFHDDQHGTAIIASAGLLNALDLTGRDIADHQARLQRRRRRRHRLPRAAARDRLPAREPDPVRHQGRHL